MQLLKSNKKLMKIECIDGRIIDTDSLTDADAEIKEIQSELTKVCIKYNVPLLSLTIDQKNYGFIGEHCVVKDQQDLRKMEIMIAYIDAWVKQRTKNNFGICKLDGTGTTENNSSE